MFDILVNILGNSVVILSIGHFKQLHSPTNVLVLSLAVTDLLVGLTVVPFSMTRAIQGCWFYGDTFCQIHTSFDFLLTSSSIFHLVCIAVDRYEAVCNPLRYTNNITMSVAWLMVLACWVVAALYSYSLIYSKVNVAGMEDYVDSIYCLGSCNVIFNNLWLAINPLILFFLPCTVMVGLYLQIFLVVKKQLRKIQGLNQNAVCNPLRYTNNITMSVAWLMVLVSWVFAALYSYDLIYSKANVAGMEDYVDSIYCLGSCNVIFNNLWGGLSKRLSTPETLYEVFAWLSYFNSSMNPIIYALFYPWFRKCFKVIVTLKIFDRNSSSMNIFFSFTKHEI
ncbi:trace amine-associated receptor 13c-like [Aplochiton taeniatus]